MLDNLSTSLPKQRHWALAEERARLDVLVDALCSIPEDRALARNSDLQGLGGSSGARTARQR
jgi:hypothetical protein